MNIVLSRVISVLALLVCIGLTGPQLVRHVDWEGYAVFSAEISTGRVEPADLPLLAPVLTRTGLEPCGVLRETSIVTLHLYANVLLAHRAGVNPFLPSEDPALTAQRIATRNLLEQALICAPMDGNLWLSLAILSRAMGDVPAQTSAYVALSQRFAPHERWISSRRDQLF